MDLLQLTYFKKIAELENVSKASRELLVAQPALSKTIRILETELDVKLFDRVGKKIYLNANGQILLKHANEILRNLEDAKSELHDINSKMIGTVTISLQAATRMLPQLLLGFKQLYPTIKIIVKKQYDNIKAIKAENFNCDFHIYSSQNELTHPNGTTLLKEECLIGFSKSHRLATAEFIDMRDLKDEDFIILQDKQCLSDITTEYCLQAGFSPNIILECDHQSAVFSLIEHNMGIAFIPTKTWDIKQHPDIVLKRIRNKKCYRYINMIQKNSGYTSSMATYFKEYIIDFFNNL